jgi:hypothetical protein
MTPRKLFAFVAGVLLVLSVGEVIGKARRADSLGWGDVPIPMPLTDANLRLLPVHWPVGVNATPLRINPLGAVPAAFDALPVLPNVIQSGWQVDASTVPETISASATLFDFNQGTDDGNGGFISYFDDAQVLPCYDPARLDPFNECDLLFADDDTKFFSLKFDWRIDISNPVSAYAQAIYTWLGTYNESVYDAAGVPHGNAVDAWEISFFCAMGSASMCLGPASLEWEGQIYTATRSVLTGPSTDPTYARLPVALNQFVFSNGTLYPPPGWLGVTSTALNTISTPITVGTPLTLTATVSRVQGAVPTGQVVFMDGSTTLGTAALSAGVATLNTTPLEGAHHYTANYQGDAVSAASASPNRVVAVNAPPPTLTFSGAPIEIPLGQNTTLTWVSTNATACTASNAWTGSKVVSGNQAVTPSAAGTLTFALDCSGSGGSISRTVVVTVHPLPTATISISPTTITAGSPVTLTWSSTNATSCSASGAWTGTQATNGTSSVTPATAGSPNYAIACTGPGGTANAATTLTVNAAPVAGNSNPGSGGGGGGALDRELLYALSLLVLLRILWTRRRRI